MVRFVNPGLKDYLDMIKKKIIFRADGNAEIGLGHITRSLALAEMLKDDFYCIFATRFLTDFLTVEIRKTCSEIIHLPGTDDHFNEFISVLTGKEIVVLDNYFFDTSYQEAIKNKGCKLVCIDDMHDKHFLADIIINHAPQVKKSDYSVEEYTQLCLGLDYLLLRPVFLNFAKKNKSFRDIESILVCFGGSDPDNLTAKTVGQLKNIGSIKKVNIVVGQAYHFLESLEFLIETNGKFRLYRSLSDLQMTKVMDVEAAIVPCSGILFECFAMKLPVITGYYVDNQKDIAEYFRCSDIGFVIGNMNNMQLTEDIIYQINKKKFDYVSTLVDGRSGERLKKVFKCLN